MATLNHVCMRSDEYGWLPITAEQAAAIHPGKTVRARSGLFMCTCCGQYVTLACGDIREPYFRHASYEDDKNCPERSFSDSTDATPRVYSPKHYELPIKLTITDYGFKLELGLLSVPKNILDRQGNRYITIKTPHNKELRKYSLSDRLNDNGITYLNLGNEPYSCYRLDFPHELSDYWPHTVRGIFENGTVFNAITGKILPFDADVQVDREYYLLTCKNLSTQAHWSENGIEFTKLCRRDLNDKTHVWTVYKFKATQLNENARVFLKELCCHLTASPVEIHPIWPLYVQTPYIIKHSGAETLIRISGNRKITCNAFPRASVKQLSKRIFSIACNDRQQIICAGDTGPLEDIYFWKETLTQTTDISAVNVEVADTKGNLQISGEQNTLPDGKQIWIKFNFDGWIIVSRNGKIINKIRLSDERDGQQPQQIDFGLKVEILQGLDVVWWCSYVRPIKKRNIEDEDLYSRLASFKDNEVPISRSLGAVATKLNGYPKTKLWIAKAIRQGYAPLQAVKYLKKHVTQQLLNS